jgi:predicted enzyme related to lactoylglutathione lyase
VGLGVIDVQRTDFVAVPTRDRERAVAFYGDTLGLIPNPNNTDRWIEFETGNLTLSIVVPEEVGIEFAPLPFGTIVLRVEDVAEAKAKLSGAGVEFIGETWDSGVCHGAIFRDPDGNSLGIHHRYAPYPDGRLP